MLSIFAYGGHFGRPFIRSFCQQLKESEDRQRREKLSRLITASCGFPKKSSLPGLVSGIEELKFIDRNLPKRLFKIWMNHIKKSLANYIP